MVKLEMNDSQPNDPEGLDVTVDVVVLLLSPAAVDICCLPAVAPAAAAAGVYSRM